MAVEAIVDVADVTDITAVGDVADVVIVNANIIGITSHENGNNFGTWGLIEMFYGVL